MATLVAAFVVETWIILPRACRENEVTFGRFVSGALVPGLPALVPAMACAAVLHHLWAADTLLRIVAQGSVSALIFFVVFAWTGVRPEERRLVRERLRGLRRAEDANAASGASD